MAGKYLCKHNPSGMRISFYIIYKSWFLSNAPNLDHEEFSLNSISASLSELTSTIIGLINSHRM